MTELGMAATAAILLTVFVANLFGCTATDLAKISALGSPGHIICYSGGQKILEADSSGIIQNAEHSDGYEFKNSATGRLVRVSAHCVVEN